MMHGDEYSLTVMGEPIEVKSPLKGVHQQRNLALAIAAAGELRNHHGYNISAAQIAEGIRRTQWPGRLERFRTAGTGGCVAGCGAQSCRRLGASLGVVASGS